MSMDVTGQPLPDFLAPCFWEVDFQRLRLSGRERYVIERVLEYGDDQAIRWLKTAFPSEVIANVVRGSRRLSRNTATLWALVLDIPTEQIRCLSRPFPQMPGSY